ncbi:helix-turn-helix transcriptional regulator [Neptuniibacter sp.]|uniref:helix-turn-helix domain-containing protein n=1 Tax=Neptuniibacter sp. TaxID=1962643 RepID=UPI002618ECAF|nr:helix-turn-helix transcriptional regulator [Neptuniibacter sp.]MCP4597950.1 helix-turn-helix domain-containing protein [Neptuniibacter sp.]
MTPFGRYLATLRLNRQVKQKELAEALGVDPSYISAIESGKKPPPSNRVIREIVGELALPKDEEALLWNYADQSIRVMHIPDDLPLETYALIQEFRKSLKSLSAGQVNVIRSVISMERNDCNERLNTNI